jgi:hypothetical protein
MAAGSWSNQQQFAIHRQFQHDVINLAAVETIKLFIFNRLQLSAEETQNTATTPSRNVSCHCKGNSLNRNHGTIQPVLKENTKTDQTL